MYNQSSNKINGNNSEWVKSKITQIDWELNLVKIENDSNCVLTENNSNWVTIKKSLELNESQNKIKNDTNWMKIKTTQIKRK